MHGLDFIKECHSKEHDWYPIVDHIYKIFPEENQFGDVNIGFNAGLINNVPYFIECWATWGVTIATVYLSKEGLGQVTEKEITDMLINNGIFRLRPDYIEPEAQVFTDRNHNRFYSYNICIGDENNTYIDGLYIFPFSILNDWNNNNNSL